MLSELASPHIRCCLSAIPSDLMKSTAVDESLSSMNQQFCSRENQLLQRRSRCEVLIVFCVKKPSKEEKLEIQLAKSRTSKNFNLRCLTNKVTPKTLQIKWKGNKFEQVIIKKAEHSLIHNRIKCTNIKINHPQTEIANTKTSLQQKLDEPFFTDLLNIIFNNKEKTCLQYKNIQIKKLKLLISRSSTTNSKMASKTTNTFNTIITSSTSSCIQDKLVINLSKKELTPVEKSLLQRGPKFAVTPNNHPHHRIHFHYYCGSSLGR